MVVMKLMGNYANLAVSIVRACKHVGKIMVYETTSNGRVPEGVMFVIRCSGIKIIKGERGAGGNQQIQQKQKGEGGG